MLSKTQSKYIHSLELQKFRHELNLFLAEGDKIAREWLESDTGIRLIIALPEWAKANEKIIAKHSEAELIIVNEQELKSISTLQNPNQVMLVVHKTTVKGVKDIDSWCLALDAIRDPGNMGTILRIADWFGIKHVACSPDCVDIYNPKVVQAGMGAHLRINIFETELAAFIQQSSLPTIAATLHGENIYNFNKPQQGILIIGNESKGVNEALLKLVHHQVTIPRIGGAESLNAGVSAGILCALLTTH
jgi:RNA methyltransferase, TrmH family